MSELQALGKVATSAVHRLRTATLKSGQPFMINIQELPKDQCYLEYPDRSIKLMAFIKGKNEFLFLRDLSARDRTSLRERLGLI